MHPASLSIKVFGVYVLLTGIGLLVAPSLVFSPLGLPAPTEIWVRVLGALAIALGLQAPLQLLLFAALDLAGAAWTWQALRQSAAE